MNSRTPVTTSNSFFPSARDRLVQYLERRGQLNSEKIQALTPDASTREYFRIPWTGSSAVVAVYPEPFDPDFHPFLDVTRLFIEAKLPVPDMLDIDGSLGIIVQEDLGDRQLFQVYEAVSEDERSEYVEKAISLIADIQSATELAYQRKSIASKLAFDEAKLSWELDFFFEHYFKSLRKEDLKHAEEAELKAEMNDIAAELSSRPRVLCHRDYHASNLMVDKKGNLRIVDHQDARMGPATYDLVSLLLDRQKEPPPLSEMREYRLYFLEERQKRGLDTIDPDDLSYEFRLMTVQRGLKAIGTFSYQTALCGRTHYAQFIEPTFQIVLQAIEWLERFPALRSAIDARINEE
jgi:N-acetylmuramate 1-kinase